MSSQIAVDNTQVSIEIVNDDVRVVAVEEPVVIVLGESGPQGPSQVVSYVYTQTVPAQTWTINHGLSFVPNIIVVDSAGSVVEGDYIYQDEETIVATFSGAFSGKAYLS